MPFEKGKSGNPNGRPKGSANRVSEEIRNKVIAFLDENFDLVQSDLKKLEPRERIKFYIDLLQYGLPKLKSIEITNDPDAITDEDLDIILEMLKNDTTK